MPLLNALDFAAGRLLVGYRASLEPQNLRVSDTFSGCMTATSVWSTEEPGAMLASRRVAIDLDVRGS